MDDLKPCPFCGGIAELIENVDEDYFFVWCQTCEAETLGCEKKDDAVRAWNRRVEK